MGGGKVRDMHIIAHAGAVAGGIVGPEHRQGRALARHRLQHQGHQMGFGQMLFAKLSVRVGTGHVEIAEDHPPQPVAGAEILQHILDRAFGPAIGIDRMLDGVFVQNHPILIPVSRASGGKDEVLYPGRNASLDQVQGAADVDAPVKPWVLHRHADQRQSGEVHHCNGPMFGQRRVDGGSVHQVALHQGPYFTASAQPVERLSKATGRNPACASALQAWLPI